MTRMYSFSEAVIPTEQLIDRLIDLSVAEDIGDGDHSSISSIPATTTGSVQLMMKQSGIIAGIEIARKVYHRIDPAVTFNPVRKDGEYLVPGDIVFRAAGRVHSLLMAERIVLNILQRMSGVATQTARYVKACEGTSAKILDTRKTTPGMRVLDKLAVAIGGGANHRMGLYDMIMLKDNHIDFAGGIKEAVSAAKNYLQSLGRELDIEVETRSLADVETVLSIGGVKRIMLDNFSVENTRRAVDLVDGRIELESSGGITLDSVRSYALCGVDYISVGAITHQISSIDMNLKKV